MAAKLDVIEILGETGIEAPQLLPIGKRLHTRCAANFPTDEALDGQRRRQSILRRRLMRRA
jgi:hypothetical protein